MVTVPARAALGPGAAAETLGPCWGRPAGLAPVPDSASRRSGASAAALRGTSSSTTKDSPPSSRGGGLGPGPAAAARASPRPGPDPPSSGPRSSSRRRRAGLGLGGGPGPRQSPPGPPPPPPCWAPRGLRAASSAGRSILGPAGASQPPLGRSALCPAQACATPCGRPDGSTPKLGAERDPEPRVRVIRGAGRGPTGPHDVRAAP